MNIGKSVPLRTHKKNPDGPPVEAGGLEDGAGFSTVADLVADLLALTELVSPDRLAAARGRAGTGSLAQALADEGVAKADGIAAALARRYDLPLAELGVSAL